MLTAADVMAAKVIVQLGFATPDEVRSELRALDKEAGTARDLVNRFTDRGRLVAKQIEVVRHRVALYEHVRSEASYVRSLERWRKVSREVTAELIAGLEETAFRRRLGELLVQQGRLTAQQDAILLDAERDAMRKDDARVLERYRREDFEGVARGLIPGSKLDPKDFKISTLFRGKETRALVAKSGIRDAFEIEESANAATAGARETGAEPTLESDEKHRERVRSIKRIGSYSIVEVLGIGGMGAVLLAQPDGSLEFVAIKVILHERATPTEKARFRRELDLTPLIPHANVIRLLDAGTTPEGLTYLVVPALAGKELRDHLRKAPNGLSPGAVIRIFTQLFSGIHAVHEAGVLHRDLKPENVFVLAGGDLELKIMDFGLAKRLTETAGDDVFRTVEGEVVGSPPYIAPETVQCDLVDARTDLYSLGVMLFEALTGRRPIDSPTPMGFYTAHLVAPPLTLAEAVPERSWPAELEAFLARLLGKARDERPASAAAALAELNALAPALLAMGAPEGGEPGLNQTKKIVSRSLLGRLEGTGRE
jgi:hypothetical protein